MRDLDLDNFYDLETGELFKFDGILVKVVVCNGSLRDCKKCIFNCNKYRYACNYFACMNEERSDGKEVYFKEVEE